MQISCLKIFIRYLKILVRILANIDNIPELIIIILLNCLLDIKQFYRIVIISSLIILK